MRFDRIFDFLWPRKCAVCGGAADRPGRHLCCDCVMRLPFVPTDGLCRRCGRDAPGLDGDFVCSDCTDELKPAFDRAGSALRFVGEARELVNSFTFNGALYLREDFADFLEAATRSRFRIEEIAFVAPMPSSPINRFYRGYNQCRYLADALADRIGVREVPDALRRVGSFRKQSELGAAERRQNVRGTFAVTRSGARALAAAGKEKAVLVVDDIMTTGSTLSECARTLKAAGAGKVWCVTLARSVRS